MPVSIQDMYERIKAFLSDDTIFFALVIILVGLASFALGRLPVDSGGVNNQPASIILSENSAIAADGGAQTAATNESSGADTNATGQYVASKNGSKYHFPWCGGAKQMKEENKIWFDSVEEAKAAGYTPAANCPGL